MRRLLEIARPAGTNHQLALIWWEQGSCEARTVAAQDSTFSRLSHCTTTTVPTRIFNERSTVLVRK